MTNPTKPHEVTIEGKKRYAYLYNDRIYESYEDQQPKQKEYDHND